MDATRFHTNFVTGGKYFLKRLLRYTRQGLCDRTSAAETLLVFLGYIKYIF